jgi:hypothetical protein
MGDSLENPDETVFAPIRTVATQAVSAIRANSANVSKTRIGSALAMPIGTAGSSKPPQFAAVPIPEGWARAGRPLAAAALDM